MKTLALFVTLVLTSLFSYAQDAENVTITVTVENVLNDQGTVLVALHTADTFMRGAGVTDLAEKANAGELTFVFEDVTPGTYAIMAMHDANDNKRMDYEASGMPKESYGMTGNDMSMGPPTFEAAKFEVGNENLEFKIRF